MDEPDQKNGEKPIGESMKSFITSIYSNVNDRLSTPLYGSFILAWVCWNHHYILILASALPIHERLAFAKLEVFPDWWAVTWRGILAPLASAVIFILAYPWPARQLYRYWHWQNKELEAAKNKIDGSKMLTVEQAQEFTGRYYRLQEEHKKEIAGMVTDIDFLRKENVRLAARTEMDDSLKVLFSWFENSWNERHQEFEKIFQQSAKAQTPIELRKVLEQEFAQLRQGKMSGGRRGYSWDCTLSAIAPNGTVIYHPTILPGTKLPQFSPLHRALAEKTGSFISSSAIVSERFSEALKPAAAQLAASNQFYGFSKIEFRQVLSGGACVVAEAHVTVLDKLPATDSLDDFAGRGDFHTVVMYLGKTAGPEGAITSELRTALPRISSNQLGELLDELVQRDLLSKEPVETAQGEYRYRLTQFGRDLVRKIDIKPSP